MAERLTRKIGYEYEKAKRETQLLEINNKLGKLEDILEKYGIDIQNLDYILEDYSKNQGRYFAVCEEMDDLKKDRDTWQKACELACEELDCNDNYYSETYTIPLEKMPQYFYQQAKKEGEN